MKKVLTVTFIFLFLFNSFPAYSEQGDVEIIGIDHKEGIIAELTEKTVYLGDSVMDQIDKVFQFLSNEIKKRQQIVEDQFENRKENFFNNLKEGIKNSFDNFLDDLFKSTRESIKGESINDNNEEEVQ